MKVLGVIPARYASTRFEGKALADLLGKPMIQHVYERASKAKTLNGLMVATDDARIFAAVKKFGGEVVMTSEHPTGTDRIAEVARLMSAANASWEIFVNVQGDEPLIEPAMINEAVEPLLKDSSRVQGFKGSRVDVATLVHRIDGANALAEYVNPNVVKVVVDRSGFAMYFSRSPIPHIKRVTTAFAPAFASCVTPIYRHVGLYVYRRDALLRFAEMPPSPFETLEGLEQLRFLENGFRMKVVETRYKSVGVDTPEDLEKVKRIMAGG